MELNSKYLISPKLNKYNKFIPKLKIAILASGKGSNFQNLINLSKKNELDVEIKILITNNNKAECINKAIKAEIPFRIINDNDFSKRDLFEEQVIKTLEENNIELIILAGWMKIISEKFVNRFKNKIINIHPSLLPSFKGKNAIEDALANGVFFTGCSVHYVETKVDSGKLIIQGVLPINPYEEKENLLAKVNLLEHKILPYGVSEAGYLIRNGFKDKNKNDSGLHL